MTTKLTPSSLGPAELAAQPGAVLPGRLQWVEAAGRGASAEVWRVISPEGGTWAVKVGLAASSAEALAVEASCLGASTAPSLPRLLGGGRLLGPPPWDTSGALGLPFLVLDWCDGGPLRGAWDRQDAALLAHLLLQGASEALVELHAENLSHGDLKPDNVLLDSAGGVLRVVLADFGLSSDVDVSEPIGGTPRYLAPEVMSQGGATSGSGDGRARDLYALGLTLAELLVPELRNVSDLRDAVSRTELPAPFERLVRPLLATHPRERPSAEWLLGQVTAGVAPSEAPARLRKRAVRRAYLALRAADVGSAARFSEIDVGVTGEAGQWLSEALVGARVAREVRGLVRTAGTARLEDLSSYGGRRFLVRAVGPSAASWPVSWSSDDELTRRLGVLAEQGGVRGVTRAAFAGEVTHQPQGDRSEPVLLALRFAAQPVDASALAEVERLAELPEALGLAAARALRLRGELARAKQLLRRLSGAEAELETALVLRRSGAYAESHAVLDAMDVGGDAELRSARAALLARDALDGGDVQAALSLLDDAQASAAALEVRALAEFRRGEWGKVRDALDGARSLATSDEQQARLWGVAGLLAHAESRPDVACDAFSRAAEHAERAGAVLEEATYLTGIAAAATNRGALEMALDGAERATLLFEHLGRGKEAARAALARAAVFALIGAESELHTAGEDALRRARLENDVTCQGYVHLAYADGLLSNPREASEHAERASHLLSSASDEDRLRASARLLVHRHPTDVTVLDAVARRDVSPEAKLEWWGARARAFAEGRREGRPEEILEALLTLANVRATGVARGPALVRGAQLALGLGRGDDARRLLATAREAASELLRGTPGALRRYVDGLEWIALAQAPSEAALLPEQLAEVENLVRSLGVRDRLKPLLEQVLDALLLWTGVERGLLLLRAPGGGRQAGNERLVVRAARNLGREDLRGHQLELSHSLARKALEKGEPVVAVDAAGELSDLHRSVHALRLRSVLAVPLIARGETQGVVYLDDRSRRGAFGSRELAWVRLVATLAAVAIADARDQLRLRRAARRAERAESRAAQALARTEAELEVAERELGRSQGARDTRGDYSAIVGQSTLLTQLLRTVDRVAASEVPVLVNGESGSGKELVARALHENGPRAGKSFIAENCAAIPEPLLESTLFGHVRGAFTGALRQRTGLFEVADQGTLFLDEVGEMPLPMQTKLLRVLQEGEIRPVGSERARRVDVRVIAATHRDLRQRVEAGLFREDLFYRLNVIALRVPPLRERPGDIPLLLQHFSKIHGKGRVLSFEPDALAALVAFEWPGNVRQLENEVRRLLVLCDERVPISMLSPEVGAAAPGTVRLDTLHVRLRVDALERELVEAALDQTGGNQTRAAELLGLSRFGLQKMMKRLDIGGPRDAGRRRSGRRSTGALDEPR